MVLQGKVIREKTRGILLEIIQDREITENLEKGIYNYTIWCSKKRFQLCNWDNQIFTEIYKNKMKQICANLLPKSYINNVNLLTKLKNKEMLPHEVAFYSPCELFPECWDKIIQEKKKRDSMLSEIDFGQATNQFKCSRCKNNKTTYYTAQTRSADEPETIFITCLTCGKRTIK
tara:strand:+ start:141 stop:662 length:522 start_codon:yes stop_codon:yes gene_type:complete